MVALVEEYEAEEEEDVEEAIESDHEDKDELTMPDHGTSLVVQRSLFFFFFFWINKNLFLKGQSPTKNTHEVKKRPKKTKNGQHLP